MGELCDRLYLDNGTVTPLLKKMEEEGLVTRTRSKKDERVVTVDVTEKGWQLREDICNVPFQIGKCIPLEQNEAFTLYQLLRKLLENMD